MKIKLVICAAFILSFSCIFIESKSASALYIDKECGYVESIFARGSGGEINKGESAVFFKQINERIPNEKIKNTTYELGIEEYGGHKYKAVDVSAWYNGNAVGAKVSNGLANDYGKSVDSGVGELYNYLTQRNEKCKAAGTKFALAGYSQGAQVIGQTLPKFTPELRKNIIYTAFFGDPKLHLPEGEGINGFTDACRGKNLSPYRRVIANCNVDNGSLGARKPYLPADMMQKERAGLWCYENDYVCGVTRNVFDNEGHSKYKDTGRAIDEATKEIAQQAKKALPTNVGDAIDTKPYSSTGTTGLDTVFLIDTTGSMGGKIQQSIEFARAQAAKIKDLRGRVALVAYKDIGDEYTAKIVSGLSEDQTAFQQGLNGLSADGGGDGPEAALHALMTAFNGLSWKNGATKAAVLLTDADFHSPDRVDGSTVEGVAKRSLEIDPVNVYPVVPAYVQSVYQELAEKTSGQVIVDTGDTEAALTQALTKIEKRPTALLKNTLYSAQPGQEVTFDASDSYVIDATITKYQWDFNGDGVFDQETTSPSINYTYAQKFDGTMQVRLTASNNTIANASAVVKIGTYVAPVLPKVPTNVTTSVVSTKDGVSTVKVSWKAADTLADKWAIKVDGVMLGLAPKTQTSIEITDIYRDKDVEFSVAGVMADGTTGDSGIVTLTKEAVTPPQPNWYQALLDCIKKIFQPIIIKLPW